MTANMRVLLLCAGVGFAGCQEPEGGSSSGSNPPSGSPNGDGNHPGGSSGTSGGSSGSSGSSGGLPAYTGPVGPKQVRWYTDGDSERPPFLRRTADLSYEIDAQGTLRAFAVTLSGPYTETQTVRYELTYNGPPRSCPQAPTELGMSLAALPSYGIAACPDSISVTNSLSTGGYTENYRHDARGRLVHQDVQDVLAGQPSTIDIEYSSTDPLRLLQNSPWTTCRISWGSKEGSVAPLTMSCTFKPSIVGADPVHSTYEGVVEYGPDGRRLKEKLVRLGLRNDSEWQYDY